MPTSTYVALATTTLSGGETSFTFSSIPATYRDLVLVTEGTHSSDSGDRFIRVNGQTTNYSTVSMLGDGSGTSSNTYSLAGMITLAAATARGSTVIQFMDYSATDKHKTVLVRGGWAGIAVTAAANRWASTDAISSITLYSSTGSFNVGFTASLYGISS